MASVVKNGQILPLSSLLFRRLTMIIIISRRSSRSSIIISHKYITQKNLSGDRKSSSPIYISLCSVSFFPLWLFLFISISVMQMRRRIIVNQPERQNLLVNRCCWQDNREHSGVPLQARFPIAVYLSDRSNQLEINLFLYRFRRCLIGKTSRGDADDALMQNSCERVTRMHRHVHSII